jgi:hypothetical protein
MATSLKVSGSTVVYIMPVVNAIIGARAVAGGSAMIDLVGRNSRAIRRAAVEFAVM